MVFVLDNYDSFTYNLVQYLGELGAEVVVRRNDEISVEEVEALKPDRILLSPGPCTPGEAGILVPLIRRLPTPLTCTRYHSLIVAEDSLPTELEITARTPEANGAGAAGGSVIMGLRHRKFPIEGVQFHPESVLTQGGHQMIKNFLEM
jgi:anthranilate/para-aminobenzoate synthase component II